METIEILQTIALCISAAALTVIALAVGLLALRMAALVTPFDLMSHADELAEEEDDGLEEPPMPKRSRRKR